MGHRQPACKRPVFRPAGALPVLTVSLHATWEGAATTQTRLDQMGCGGRCGNRHEIVCLGGEVDFASAGPLEGFDV
jgi:hypothetical protein